MAHENRKKKAVPKRGNASNRLLPLVIAFVFGYLLASLFNFHQLTRLASDLLAKNDSEKRSAALKNGAELPKPKFEFYSLLTGEHVPAATKHVAQVVVAKPIASKAREVTHVKASQVNTLYLLQVASFKTQVDADRLKASLVLNGYDAVITIVSAQQATWYRVNIGPFKSMSQAESVQIAVARSEHVMGMIRKMRA